MISATRPTTAQRYYDALIAPRTPLACLALNEVNGNPIDFTGNTSWTYGGTMALAAMPSPLNRGAFNVASFDGSTSYAQGPNSSAVAVGLNFTLEAWVKPAATQPNDFETIVSRRELGGTGYEIQRYGPSTQLAIFVGNASGTFYDGGSAGNEIPTGVWTLITIRRMSSTVSFFLNGVKVRDNTLNTDATSINPNTNLRIGDDSYGYSRRFAGGIFGVQLTSATPSDADILAGYLQTINGQPF